MVGMVFILVINGIDLERPMYEILCHIRRRKVKLQSVFTDVAHIYHFIGITPLSDIKMLMMCNTVFLYLV